MFYEKRILEEVLVMYLMGASVDEISAYVKLGSREVNEILDCYVQYL